MNQKLIKKVIQEIKHPTLEATKQYLSVHNVVFENDLPKIELIDQDSYIEVDSIYVRIVDEPFFLIFNFSKENAELLEVDTRNSNQIYFTATSESKTFNELSQLTKLKVTKGWSYDQLRPNGKTTYGFSRISYEPIVNRAFDFDKKLEILLTHLESDSEGIINITKSANAIISIHHQMYILGNKGIYFDNETLLRLSQLNLGIDIDQYVYGKEIEE